MRMAAGLWSGLVCSEEMLHRARWMISLIVYSDSTVWTLPAAAVLSALYTTV